jgi:hypothetical protein
MSALLDLIAEVKKEQEGPPLMLWFWEGEDPDVLYAAHTKKGEKRPMTLCTWRGLYRPRPEFCSARSVSTHLAIAKAHIARDAASKCRWERAVARENEEHWRALCRRFEVDYDGVPAALEVTSR